MAPKVIIAGKVLWAKKELDEYGQRATIVYPDISSREAFLSEVSSQHADAVAIFATNGANIGKYDAELLNQLPKSLKYICWHGAGYDPVDVAAATQRGIEVSHTPQAVDHGTATTALYLLIGAIRQFAHAEMNARKGDWLKDFPLAHDPEHKVLGIVGMGGIGKALARRAIALDMKIIYYNRKKTDHDFEATYCSSLDELLAQADVVSLHMPLNEKTKNSFGKDQFAKMKDGSVLVNTARGGVVDQEALLEALESGKLYSAGLDVFPNEPEIDERLRSNPKISILPHVGTHTLESRYGMEMLVLRNVISALDGKGLITQVPEQRQ